MDLDNFQARKEHAIRMSMQAGAARHIELLIEQVETKIEPDRLFTRDELIELLRGMAERMKGNQ